VTSSGQPRGMSDVVMSTSETPLVALLRTWQSHTRTLLDDLHPQPHPEGVLPAPELAERAAALRRLRWTMLPRESRKQRFLAPSLRRHLYSNDDLRALDELVDRKLAFERQLVVLRWVDERSRLFDQELTELIDKVIGYLRCEATLLSRLATQVPAAEQADVMRSLTSPGGWLLVQPHPDIPRTRWIAAVMEPVAALLDRLRDRFSTAPG